MGTEASPGAPSPAGAANGDAQPRPPAAAAEAAADGHSSRSAPPVARRNSKLVSVSEDYELAHMEAGGGAGGSSGGGAGGDAGVGARGETACAPSSSTRAQLQPTGSVSAYGSVSLSLVGPRGENGGDSERSKSAPPSPGGLAASAAATLQQRLRKAWADAMHIWWGLPSACKMTMVLAVVNFCISCAYAIVGIMLPDVDEEIHISITIIVSSVFVMFSVVDAVIYENTLELVAAILLDTLVLARMVWFASQGSANASFKWTWVSIMCAFQVLFMATALLAWRQFGWRLYGKIGGDFREKGAASRMRKALQRNAYVTVLKINVMFLCVLTAIGVDVSVEKRNDVQPSLMAISLVGLFVGCGATWMAAKLSLKQRNIPIWALLVFHALMALALAQPVAVLAIYNTDNESRANATVSLNVGGGVYMFTSILCWLATIRMIRRNERALSRGGAASMAANSGAATGDPRLAPMQAGAWLGKPTQRNPRKIRFFQLSHDGSTLRWGWNKFVRLYYVDDLICNDDELTIALAFPFEAELTLKFPDASTYQAWRRGFAHLLLCLMAPDAPGPTDATNLPAAAGQPSGSSKAAAGWGVVGRTTSRGLMRSTSGSGLDWQDSLPGRRTTSTAFQALQKLGVRVQELGRRVGPRQRTSQGSSLGERPSRRATGESDWAGLPSSEGASGGSRGQPDTPPGVAERQRERTERAAERDAAQQAKRQRMVAYLQSVAQHHPTSVPPVPPVVLRRDAATTPSPPTAAPQPSRRRRRISEEPGGHVRLMVSVGVQTDESALQQLLYQSARAAAPSTPPHAASAAAAPLSAPRRGSDGGDADIAAQYAAALAAAGGSGGSAGSSGGRRQQPQQPPQAQQQPAEGGSDAEIANQWMAAMMAAGGPGGTAAGAAPFGSPHPEQPAAVGPASSGGDEDVAAQYLAAMQAAMGPAGASPPASQQQQGQQAAEQRVRQHRPPQHSPPTPGSEQPTPAHSQRSLAHYSLPASASPLEQLAWHQQQRSLQQMQQGSPASGTSAVWHGGGTPGWNTPQRSQSLALGAGLWQLAAAVDVIDFEELSFGKLLGAGAEGAVYAAWFLESPVAVKKFNRVEDSLHEVQMYLLLGSHDNIVALRGLCQHEGSMYLVLEYCPRGTLDVLLHHTARNPWDPQKLLPLIRSIARGMHYLHSRNILHRDLKPANIFVGHGQLMKIGDFGMARIVDESGPPALRRLTPGVVGTLQYSAPELLNDDLRPQGTEDAEWALKLDVWSFGVTVWEILERRRPFEGLTQHAVQAQWMADPYSACLPPVRLPEHLDKAGKRIYRGLADLVEDCTRLDPFARPSFRDVLLRLKSLAGFAERQDMPF